MYSGAGAAALGLRLLPENQAELDFYGRFIPGTQPVRIDQQKSFR
jgi:hypothetical protein